MITQTYTRPRRAAVSPAAKAVGPVTKAIRGLRPNEMPSWEMREQEMRRQEAADLRALRRRVAKAVSVGIDFLDATGGDPDAEEENEHGEDIQDEPHDGEEDAGFEDERGEETLGWCENVGQLALGPNTADGDATALERKGRGFIRSGHEDDEDSHDREAVNEDGGDIQDEPHDGDERELDMAEWGVGDADGLAEVLGQAR